MTPVSVGPYEGPGLGAFGVWKCPACGTENATEFGTGCPACGAGQPGRHVGIDPPPTQRPVQEKARAVQNLPNDPVVFETAADRAFDDWQRRFSLPATLIGFARAAFQAGWDAAASRNDLIMPVQLPPAASTVSVTYAAEGKVARTLAAALRAFRDQMLTGAEEEIAAGEWLSLDEADALIAQLEKEGQNPYV